MNNASLELGGDNWAAKDGNLLGYAVGDSSGKYVPNEFTFTRGSNLSATRVNEDGYIEKGYENLLLQSNSFLTTWALTPQISISGNQIGYDGTNDAWILEKGTNSYRRIYQNITLSGVWTFSVYAKANTLSRIDLRDNSFNGTGFDLSNGSIISSTNVVDSSIEIVNGTTDWYRCSVTFSASSSQVMISVGWADLISGSIYIQDAMINQGLVAYPYIETTTASVEAGVLENEPRIDYSSGTASLLLEPSRTNLIPYSDWVGAFTQLQSISVDIDDTIGPEGYANVSKLTSTANNSKATSGQITYVAGTTYTFSAWVKNIDASTVQFLWYDGSSNFVNKTGEVNTESFTRISFSFTPTTSTSAGQIQIGRDLISGQSFYVYGAQLEAGSYPTSYIPTYGVSQTRSQDSLDTLVIDELTDSYTISLDITRIDNDEDSHPVFMEIKANSPLEGEVELRSQSLGRLRLRFFDDADTLEALYTSGDSFTQGNLSKIAIRYNGNGFQVFVNGVSEAVTSNIGATTLNKIVFINRGILGKLMIFPTALTDSECIELTTI